MKEKNSVYVQLGRKFDSCIEFKKIIAESVKVWSFFWSLQMKSFGNFVDRYLKVVSERCRSQDEVRMRILCQELLKMEQEKVIVFSFDENQDQVSNPEIPRDWKGPHLEVKNPNLWTKIMRQTGLEISQRTR